MQTLWILLTLRNPNSAEINWKINIHYSKMQVITNTHTLQLSGMNNAPRLRALSIPMWRRLSLTEYLQWQMNMGIKYNEFSSDYNSILKTKPHASRIHITFKILHVNRNLMKLECFTVFNKLKSTVTLQCSIIFTKHLYLVQTEPMIWTHVMDGKQNSTESKQN